MARIKIGDPIEQELWVEEPPSEALWAQPQQLDKAEPFQVYILRETHQQIWQQLKASPEIECGGVLVGYPFRTPNQRITFVIIAGCIPQKASHSSVVHFTVGPEQAAAARDQLATNYPGLSIVGWYHSHPGHGIFLSEQDMTIVRSIYNSDWHIALVIDPQRKQEGFFVGPHGTKLPPQSWVEIKQSPLFLQAVCLYNKYEELIALGQIGSAQREAQHFNQLISTSPELTHWRGRAIANLTAQQPEESAFQRTTKENFYQQGIQYFEMGNWANAKRYLELYINSEPTMRRTFEVLDEATRNLKEVGYPIETGVQLNNKRQRLILRGGFLAIYGLLLIGTFLTSALNSSPLSQLLAFGCALLTNLVAVSSAICFLPVEGENNKEQISTSSKWLLGSLILMLFMLLVIWIAVLSDIM